MSHGGRGGKVRSGKLEGRGGQHFSLLEILSSSRRTQWAQNIFEFMQEILLFQKGRSHAAFLFRNNKMS